MNPKLFWTMVVLLFALIGALIGANAPVNDAGTRLWCWVAVVVLIFLIQLERIRAAVDRSDKEGPE
jgi:hypothetical protein